MSNLKTTRGTRRNGIRTAARAVYITFHVRITRRVVSRNVNPARYDLHVEHNRFAHERLYNV